MSFIFLTITLIFIYSFRKLTFAINLKFIKNYCMFIFFICIIGFVSKNFIRIYNNYNILYENYPWPKIYTLKDNEQNKLSTYKKIKDRNDRFLYFYSGGKECMYSRAPCSNFEIKNLKINEMYGYKFISQKILIKKMIFENAINCNKCIFKGNFFPSL